MKVRISGASKSAGILLGNLNRRLQLPFQLFLRFSGFFFLTYILYLNFLFDVTGASSESIALWISIYILYLLILEIINYFWNNLYNTWQLETCRIISNILIMSWLILIAPNARFILIVGYFIPILASILYFPDKGWITLAVFLLSSAGLAVCGIFLAGINPLSILQYLTLVFIIGIFTFGASYMYKTAQTISSSMADIAKDLFHEIDVSKLASKIARDVLQISRADCSFVYIRDPNRTGKESYLVHKFIGQEIADQYSITDLISECEAIKFGFRFYSDDVQKSKKATFLTKYLKNKIRSIIIEPITDLNENVAGLIAIGHQEANAFSPYTIKLVEQLSTLVASAIENCIKYRKAHLEIARGKEINERLLKANSEEEILDIIMEEAIAINPEAIRCVLHKFVSTKGFNDSTGLNKQGILEKWTSKPPEEVSNSISLMETGKGIAGHSLLREEPIIISDVNTHPLFDGSTQDLSFVSLLVAPIIDRKKNNAIGTISVESNKIDAFQREDELQLEALANQAALILNEFRDKEGRWKILKILDIPQQIDPMLKEQTVCELLAKAAIDILEFGMSRIRIVDNNDDLVTFAVAGLPDEKAKNLMGDKIPHRDLNKFLVEENKIAGSYLIQGTNKDWIEFADKFMYIPTELNSKQNGWRAYDAFITPLWTQKGNIIGYLFLDQPKEGHWHILKVIESVSVFAGIAGWIIDLNHAKQRIQEQQSLIMSFVSEIGQKSAIIRDKNAIGELAVQVGAKLLNAEGCSLHLVEDDHLVMTNSNYLMKTIYFGRRKKIFAGPGSGLTAWVAATNEYLSFENGKHKDHIGWAKETDHLVYLPSGLIESLLIFPISINNNTLGVFTLENKMELGEIVAFDDEDLAMVQHLTTQLANALINIPKYEDLRHQEFIDIGDDIHLIKNFFQFGVVARIDVAKKWFDRGEFEKAQEHLSIMSGNAHTIIDELYLIHSLVHRNYYKIENLNHALEALKDNLLLRENQPYEEEMKIDIICPTDIKLHPFVHYIFLRVATEALLNAVNHSGILTDRNIRIDIPVLRGNNFIELSVKDNGVGCETFREGYGFRRMRDFVSKLNQRGFRTRLTSSTIKGNGFELKLKTYLDEV